MLLAKIIDLYSLIVFGAVVVSWLRLPRYHPVARFFYQLTEPLLAPLRRILPMAGGLDFTPMVLLVALQLFKSFLI